MDTHHRKDGQIGTALESLTRQVAASWQDRLADLRTRMDQQLASLEAALDGDAHAALITTTVEQISRVSAEQINRARHQAEATASQALNAIEAELRGRLAAADAANASLRSELDSVRKELESARQALDNQKSSEAAAAQKLKELTAERAELVQKIASVTAARSAADAQCRQLEAVNRKLSEALSKMLRAREADRTAAAERPSEAASRVDLETARAATPTPIPPKNDMGTPAPSPATAATATDPASPPKKPLQFSTPARDAKRVKIRRGITVDVDGIPGELVDLSLGGAQALLRLSVKPNQLVRLSFPTANGQIICRGRIVWSVYEQPRTSVAVYRTGVKFSEIDTTGIDKFMNDYAEEQRPALQSSGAA